MLIAMIVFGPFIGAAAAAVIGKRNEKAGDHAALLVTALILGLTLVLARGAGGGTLYVPPAELPSAGAAGTAAQSARLTIPDILVGGLTFSLNGFRAIYACITAIMWFATTLFALEYFAHERQNIARYRFFVLFTLGAVEGVMLSGDFMTAFVFFEILSFTSFTWVIHEETWEAISAGYTYLFVAVIGGLLLFMGLILLDHAVGTLSFEGVREAMSGVSSGTPSQTGSVSMTEVRAAGILILLGFGAKAGMFPLHIWLPKAHPVAPSPASALLSGILTKVGIYGILMTALYVLAGDLWFGLIVFAAGLITMLLGAILALFSVNLKRTLACSSMSQIGFILTGIGTVVLAGAAGAVAVGNLAEEANEVASMALAGTVQHMINHSLLKLTLFMAAGVVVMNLHTLTLDEIRGWGRSKTALKIAFALGALGISGVPLFNGYISKTLLHEGIVEAAHIMSEMQGDAFSYLPDMLHAGEWIFLFSGGLTFAYMLKLFICIFVEKNSDAGRQTAFDSAGPSMNAASTAAILGSSLFMVILGIPPVVKRLLYFGTGSEHIMEFRAFAAGNLKGGAISLGIGVAVYLLFVRRVLLWQGRYVNRWPGWLDLEQILYAPLLTEWQPGVFGAEAADFGENIILIPLCRFLLNETGEFIAWLSGSTDGMILMIRRTLLRERKARTPGVGQISRMRLLREGTAEALEPLIRNFSFALLMTCLGIILILGVLLVSILHIG